MKIFAFHLLNDYSGSPKVLMQLAKGWVKQGFDVNLACSTGRKGFLSDIEGVRLNTYWYKWHQNPFVRLFNLLASQLLLIIKYYGKIKVNDIVYVNTVYPFGAAILGKLKGARVIYHMHETTVKPKLLKKMLFGIVKKTASDVVYVSNYVSRTLKIKGVKSHVLFNAIEEQYYLSAKANLKKRRSYKNVLMVCSLKWYKGINEFVQLACDNNEYNFKLVLNATKQDIDDYFKGKDLPVNLELFPTQTNLHPFFKWADVILNLSRPDGWVETFGLTIIEGMCYGLPAIVPNVGGITEVVKDAYNGFHVDSRNRNDLNVVLTQLMGNKHLYAYLSKNALEAIEQFREDVFNRRSLSLLEFKEGKFRKMEYDADYGRVV